MPYKRESRCDFDLKYPTALMRMCLASTIQLMFLKPKGTNSKSRFIGVTIVLSAGATCDATCAVVVQGNDTPTAPSANTSFA
eukprot:9681-Heterococcus_DN1.PRE.2